MLRAVVVTVACCSGAATPAEDDPPKAQLPYLQATPEDGFVARTLRQERVFHRQFAAAFDDRSAGCSASAAPFYAPQLFLFRHGAVFDFDGFGVVRPTYAMSTPGEPGWVTSSFGPPSDGGTVSARIAPDGTGYVGTASAADCTIEIRWRKFARREGRWVEADPVERGDVKDWAEREKCFHWPAPDGSAENMTFLFDTAADDRCPEGGGLVVVRPHSLLSEIGGRGFTGRIVREDATRFSNDFEIVTGNCRYAVSVRLSSRDSTGLLYPVPVSPAVTAFRDPAGP